MPLVPSSLLVLSTTLEVTRPETSYTTTPPCPEATLRFDPLMATEVWPPAQSGSTQMKAEVCCVFWLTAEAKLSALPPRVTPETLCVEDALTHHADHQAVTCGGGRDG